MSQNRDRVTRVVQQRRSRQVNGIERLQLTSQGAGARNDIRADLDELHPRDELIDHADIEAPPDAPPEPSPP